MLFVGDERLAEPVKASPRVPSGRFSSLSWRVILEHAVAGAGSRKPACGSSFRFSGPCSLPSPPAVSVPPPSYTLRLAGLAFVTDACFNRWARGTQNRATARGLGVHRAAGLRRAERMSSASGHSPS